MLPDEQREALELAYYGGFRVVDVWESEEAFARFGELLMPILQEIGVEGRPEVYPAHTYGPHSPAQA